jgi:hypothetical protein
MNCIEWFKPSTDRHNLSLQPYYALLWKRKYKFRSYLRDDQGGGCALAVALHCDQNPKICSGWRGELSHSNSEAKVLERSKELRMTRRA